MKRIVTIVLLIVSVIGVKAQSGIITNGLFDNCFVQAGLDMSLQCPYGKDFSQVFPKGKTFGIDAAVGKWFSPLIAVRLRLNWENGIGLFRNNHLEWLSTGVDGKSNMDCGGYITATFEVPVSFSNIIWGYDSTRKWNGIVFARMGLISNRATDSASPLVGGGIGTTYKLNSALDLYGEIGVQATTSEFYNGVSLTGMDVPTGFNCMFNFELGVIYTFNAIPFRTINN